MISPTAHQVKTLKIYWTPPIGMVEVANTSGNITAIINTDQARKEYLAGTLPSPQRDMLHFNNSRTDMISACLKEYNVLINSCPNTKKKRPKHKKRKSHEKNSRI